MPEESGQAGDDNDDEKEAALSRLARRLFEIEEHLDPGPPSADDPEDLTELWERLDECSKRFYRFSVEELLSERADVLRVLGVNRTDNDVILGGFKHGE
jgi:hypothetical protein